MSPKKEEDEDDALPQELEEIPATEADKAVYDATKRLMKARKQQERMDKSVPQARAHEIVSVVYIATQNLLNAGLDALVLALKDVTPLKDGERMNKTYVHCLRKMWELKALEQLGQIQLAFLQLHKEGGCKGCLIGGVNPAGIPSQRKRRSTAHRVEHVVKAGKT